MRHRRTPSWPSGGSALAAPAAPPHCNRLPVHALSMRHCGHMHASWQCVDSGPHNPCQPSLPPPPTSPPTPAAHLLTDTQVGNATPFSICLPLKMLPTSLRQASSSHARRTGRQTTAAGSDHPFHHCSATHPCVYLQWEGGRPCRRPARPPRCTPPCCCCCMPQRLPAQLVLALLLCRGPGASPAPCRPVRLTC